MQMNQTELDILQATVDAEKANPALTVTEHKIAAIVNLDVQEIRAYLRLMERKSCVHLQNISTHNNESVWVKMTPEGYMALRGRNEFSVDPNHSSVSIENLIKVENAHHSQFQQGTHDSTQNLFIDSTVKAQLTELLDQIKKLVINLEFDNQTKDDLESDIQTVEAQVSNSKPKKAILKVAFESIASILKGSVEKAISNELASHATSILQQIHERMNSL